MNTILPAWQSQFLTSFSQLSPEPKKDYLVHESSTVTLAPIKKQAFSTNEIARVANDIFETFLKPKGSIEWRPLEHLKGRLTSLQTLEKALDSFATRVQTSIKRLWWVRLLSAFGIDSIFGHPFTSKPRNLVALHDQVHSAIVSLSPVVQQRAVVVKKFLGPFEKYYTSSLEYCESIKHCHNLDSLQKESEERISHLYKMRSDLSKLSLPWSDTKPLYDKISKVQEEIKIAVRTQTLSILSVQFETEAPSYLAYCESMNKQYANPDRIKTESDLKVAHLQELITQLDLVDPLSEVIEINNLRIKILELCDKIQTAARKLIAEILGSLQQPIFLAAIKTQENMKALRQELNQKRLEFSTEYEQCSTHTQRDTLRNQTIQYLKEILTRLSSNQFCSVEKIALEFRNSLEVTSAFFAVQETERLCQAFLNEVSSLKNAHEQQMTLPELLESIIRKYLKNDPDDKKDSKMREMKNKAKTNEALSNVITRVHNAIKKRNLAQIFGLKEFPPTVEEFKPIMRKTSLATHPDRYGKQGNADVVKAATAIFSLTNEVAEWVLNEHYRS